MSAAVSPIRKRSPAPDIVETIAGSSHTTFVAMSATRRRKLTARRLRADRTAFRRDRAIRVACRRHGRALTDAQDCFFRPERHLRELRLLIHALAFFLRLVVVIHSGPHYLIR